jgi:hypothetical protein
VLIGVDDLVTRAGADRNRDDLVGHTPLVCAATAFWCERTASSSCSVREMPYWRRKILRGLQHAAGHRVVLAPAVVRNRGPAVVHGDAATSPAPAHVGGVDGTLLIDSAPPAMTRSMLPLDTWSAAWMTACTRSRTGGRSACPAP